MPSVSSYKVGTSRAVRGGAVRWLTLQISNPTAGIKEVSAFFWEKVPHKLGFVNRTTGFVCVNLPLADFDPMYRILNTEQPIFVHWRTDPEDDHLASFDVSTSEEPVGEGFPDKSP
jgi:hypothetical protein